MEGDERRLSGYEYIIVIDELFDGNPLLEPRMKKFQSRQITPIYLN